MTSNPYPDSMKVGEYLDTLRASRAAYAHNWESLSPDQMTRRPGPQSDWSIKDLIGHLCWWETYAVTRVMLMRAGGTLPRLDDFDALNAQVFNAWKDIALPEVLKEWESNLIRIEGYILSLTDEAFNTPDPHDGRSPFQMMGGNTLGHYLDHLPDLERYVTSLKT